MCAVSINAQNLNVNFGGADMVHYRGHTICISNDELEIWCINCNTTESFEESPDDVRYRWELILALLSKYDECEENSDVENTIKEVVQKHIGRPIDAARKEELKRDIRQNIAYSDVRVN